MSRKRQRKLSSSSDSSDCSIEMGSDVDDVPLSIRYEQLVKDRKWKKSKNSVFNPQVHEFTDENYGVQQECNFDENSTPEQIFEYFFDSEVMELILDETTKYYEQDEFRKRDETLDLTEDELYSFIAIQIYMGNVHYPEYAMYWSTEPMYDNLFIRKIMNRERFTTIHRFLHFSSR